jgi:TolA-binding protein
MTTRGLPALALLAALVGAAAAQPTPDQQAATLLNVARKAYADANPQFAADRFREFLQKFPTHADAHSARLGLAVALLDLPDRNHQAALDALTPAAADANFPDRPLALYYAGACRRGLGLKALADKQPAANDHFAEAGKFFAAAREAFEKKGDAEWAARCRCDAAEAELRLGKAKEARATAEPFVKDAALAKSAYRPLGLYYHGLAAFLLDDVSAAGRSLGQLAPFDQPFGPHARYLMGRVHEKGDEKAEAAAAFAAVLAGYEEQKKAAQAALQQPDRFKHDPWEKARLEALVKGPPPDHVAGAAFYGACLAYEAGKFGEALPRFQAFAKEYAASPLKDDALLRAGFCLVQSKAFDEAAKTFQPLATHPRLADQAQFWLGKAQVGLALATDPSNGNVRSAAFAVAVNLLRTAADKANAGDADAKARRPGMLLELADALLLAGKPKDAAAVYDQLSAEKALPGRAEELLQRSADAHALGGDVATSEARVAAFRQQFPNSPLLPLVLFRGAENAFARAETLAKEKKAAEAKAAYADAAGRYEAVVKGYPEFERASRARYGVALCLLAAEDWDRAIAALEAIPAPDRTGDLAPVSYVLADCLVRTAPAKAEDALQDNMLREKLSAAAVLLDAFVASNPKAEQAPDALLKYGLCLKRLGAQLAPGNERNDALNKARAAFERLTNDGAFNKSPLVGHAALERAKVLALQGDKGNAVNALRGFTGDPLGKSPVAPLAHVALATLLREQNQPQPAADLLAQARTKFENQLATDPARAEWVALLRYHHGVALFEAGKLDEARQAFAQASAAGDRRPIAAEAALKAGQCAAEDARRRVAAAEKERGNAKLTPQQAADIDARVKAAKSDLRAVAKLLVAAADAGKAAHPQSEARARMFYDSAWAARAADADPLPAYTKLIAEFPDLSLAVEGRLELAELLVERKPDDAVKLLKEAIDKEPTDRPTPPETLERVRLRLGAALFDKKDYAAAQGQFDSVAANEKSPHRGQGLYRSAECLLAQGKADEAAKKLVIFRDNGAFHNVAGVSDRAVLRLGHAYLALKQWEPARQSFEAVLARYGSGPWAPDARYGVGVAFQNQGKFAEAIGAYTEVVKATQDDRAGRARLQIGECHARQGRWKEAGAEFQAVYLGFDIPELKWAAMLEHARVLVEQKDVDTAAKRLERVLRDAPKDSEWAKAAAERLEKLPKK